MNSITIYDYADTGTTYLGPSRWAYSTLRLGPNEEEPQVAWFWGVYGITVGFIQHCHRVEASEWKCP